MEAFFKILACIIAIPIALVVMVAAIITLIGGYTVVFIKLFWWVILLVFAIIVGVKLLKHFTKR